MRLEHGCRGSGHLLFQRQDFHGKAGGRPMGPTLLRAATRKPGPIYPVNLE
jgi:hypothetical protein